MASVEPKAGLELMTLISRPEELDAQLTGSPRRRRAWVLIYHFDPIISWGIQIFTRSSFLWTKEHIFQVSGFGGRTCEVKRLRPFAATTPEEHNPGHLFTPDCLLLTGFRELAAASGWTPLLMTGTSAPAMEGFWASRIALVLYPLRWLQWVLRIVWMRQLF